MLCGIFFGMLAMNLTPERYYEGDKEGEYKMLFVLQGLQLCLLLLVAQLEIIPVLWSTVFVLGVLRILYICLQTIKS